MDITPEQLRIVRNILARHLKNCKVLAFGSRVSGSSEKFSDLDLAIVGNEELSLRLISDLKDAFSESNLPFRVDILDWTRTSENFRNIILKRSEQIFPE